MCSNEDSRLPVVHIFEGKELGHGPLWLGYLVGGVLPAASRVIVSYPNIEVYDEFVEQWKTYEQIEFRPFAYPLEAPRYRNALKIGLKVKADVTIVTFLDVFALKENEDLLGAFHGTVMGLWFLAPRQVASTPLQRLFSRKLRRAHQLAKQFQNPPRVIKHIFVLDEALAVLVGDRADLSVKVLPDPWHSSQLKISQADARRRLNLPEGKKIFLHFGSTDTRKGIEDVIEAWGQPNLPEDAYLVRAGRTRRKQSEAMMPLIQAGRAKIMDRYISDDELDAFLCASDWVLLPYRDHFGSSGALAGAAAARRPVVCSDSGILGDRVRKMKLGILFKAKDAVALAQAVAEATSTDTACFEKPLESYSRENSVKELIARVTSSIESTRLSTNQDLS